MIELRKVKSLQNVISKWKKQYRNYPPDSEFGIVTKKLEALPKNATAMEVNAIIGNDSWTLVWCVGCGEYVNAAVQFHDEDSAVCKRCLEDALTLIERADKSHCSTCQCNQFAEPPMSMES